MARTGINLEQVVMAAEQITSQGETPTIEKIRFMLGAGSNTTISKYLNDWRNSRLVVKPSVTSPPDQVQAAVSAVWEKLHQETQATIEAVKAEAKDQVEAARQEVETANTALSALKAEHEALKTQHHALSAQKELLALDYKQAEANQQLLRERLEALEFRHQEMKTLHEQQLNRLEEKYLAEIARLKSYTEQEVQLARQLADTLKSHYEDARVDSMRQLDQLKVENQKSYDAMKRLEADNAGLKQSLESKIAMHQQVMAQLTEAQRLIQTQQTQWDVLLDKRFVTEEIVAAFQALPVQVASELHTLLTEQVKGLIDQAAKAMHNKLKEIEHA
jgi:chromosome segregation ATPase